MERLVARVMVEQLVEVEVDRSKFTEQFMAEFRESFFDFDSIEEHMLHLGQLYARDVVDNGEFIEGYGPADDMGIRFKSISTEEYFEKRPAEVEAA
jgi:hypothetical protein